MFCINCGKQLEEGAKFCIYCGATQDSEENGNYMRNEDAGARSFPSDNSPGGQMSSSGGQQMGVSAALQDEPATSGGLVMFAISVALGALAMGSTFLDWVAVESPAFFGLSVKEQCSLWKLISLLMDLHHDSPEDGFIILAFLVAIPLLVMAVGGLLWLVGGVAWIITKTARKAWGWLLASSVFMLLSNIVFMIMLFGTKMLIDAVVDDAAQDTFGLHIKTSDYLELKPALWAWMMLALVAAMIVLLICAKRGLGKKARQGGYNPATPIPVTPSAPQVVPYVPDQQNFQGPDQSDPFMGMDSPIQPLMPINPTEGTYMPMDDDDDQTQMLGGGAGNMFAGDMGSYSVPGLVMFQDKADSSQIYGCGLDVPVIIGRDPDGCNIVINSDKSISRKHCRLYKNNNVCYVEDLNSFNHTYINDVMLTSPAPLKRGMY